MEKENTLKTVDCPHRAQCGACSLLAKRYASQLRRKQDWLGEALKGKIQLRPGQLLQTLPSPLVEGYRNRAKMTLSSDRDGHVLLGYFQRRSREVVDAPGCGVLVPELLETTHSLRRLLNSSRAFPFELRHIDLRCGSNPHRQHLTLVLRSEKMVRLPIEAISEACRNVDGISVNLNPRGGAQVIKGAIEHAAGVREVWVEASGVSLRVSPGSFFQVNLSLLPEIHRKMSEFLGRGDVLIDLYAGVGTHAVALRENFNHIYCVEGVRASVADARASIQKAGIDSIEMIASPVLRSLRRLRTLRPAAFILNPSRAGADAPALETIIASSARRLAYLSCDPKTLARDLAVLLAGGFRLESIQAVDMMPQTRQVEALAFLRR